MHHSACINQYGIADRSTPEREVEVFEPPIERKSFVEADLQSRLPGLADPLSVRSE
jgi:hypothetical protein